jgi:Cdc6-like AAA superfamily ATPase
VGWTAPTVKNKFRMAKGSVLFIDEAYSLVEEHNSFGNEAINTIVQEMENNREDIIVIFAGYPKEMEGFLNKNPGLRSRIGFHIDFEDYNSQQLYSITELIAKKAGLQLDNGVRERLLPIFDNARKNDDFGNGRFARNLFEKAKMKQAGRLIDTENIEMLTDSDISTLLPEDFDVETQRKIEQKKTIGFV